MSGKYGQYKGRKRIRRGRRRRQTGIVKTAGVAAAVLLSFIIMIGFAGRIKELSFAEPSAAGSDEQGSDAREAGNDIPWYLTLVNKQNRIPEDYRPKLVRVEGGEQVDERIYGALMEMLEAAKEKNQGQMPLVVSGYRTKEKQQSLYDEKIKEFKKEGYSDSEAKELADKWVAAPDYSEHQLGFAVDINGEIYDLYSWLQENSYKYGFIFRYPGNKTRITGVAEEVWHYRYVGVEAAARMHEQGLCLEEYLGEISNVS